MSMIASFDGLQGIPRNHVFPQELVAVRAAVPRYSLQFTASVDAIGEEKEEPTSSTICVRARFTLVSETILTGGSCNGWKVLSVISMKAMSGP